MSLRTALIVLALSVQAKSEFLSSLSQCVQNCINKSTYQTCDPLNIPCICQEGSGNFLPDVISCMHRGCNNNLDSNLFLTPLSIMCEFDGTPIPASALSSAENAASSLATQATITATVTVGGDEIPLSTITIPGPWTTAVIFGSVVSWGGPVVSTVYGSYVSTVTVTTTISGSTVYQIYPITAGQKTTVLGQTSIITSTVTGTTSKVSNGAVPIVVTTTNSAGSTYTTTNSRGSTVTQESTYTQITTSSEGSISSRQSPSSGAGLTATRSSAAGGASSAMSHSSSHSSAHRQSTSTIFLTARTSVSSSIRASTGITGGSSRSTDSAPFTNTNAGSNKRASSWLGLSLLLGMLGAWM
jgi:hypothetical protein